MTVFTILFTIFSWVASIFFVLHIDLFVSAGGLLMIPFNIYATVNLLKLYQSSKR